VSSDGSEIFKDVALCIWQSDIAVNRLLVVGAGVKKQAAEMRRVVHTPASVFCLFQKKPTVAEI
jgi:hypothetical protein